MRPWLAALVVISLPGPAVALADEPAPRPFQLEVGASLGVGGIDSVGVPDGFRAGALYQPWEHVGFALDVRHLIMDQGAYQKGLCSFDSATLGVRLSGALGPVTIFFVPSFGLARGTERDGDVELHDTVHTRPALGVHAGLELALAKGFLVGAAGYAVTSPLTDAFEGNAGVDLYAGYRF